MIFRYTKCMIQLTNVSKSYKNNRISILKSITLSINASSHVAITGPSGSGKSTLLRMVAGVESPTSGIIQVNHQNLYELDDDARAHIRRRAFGFIFQSFRLFSSLTALDNVGLGLTINGDPNPLDTALHWLNDVGLSHRANHYPDELSGGERQRVAIARALATQPQCIIADEPTGNLDQGTSHRIRDLLTDCLKKTNASLLLVTHDLNLADMCPTVYQLTDGQLTQ
jgi:putative ABC transport system ATP-binding protein